MNDVKEFRTQPGLTANCKPDDFFVNDMLAIGRYQIEVIPADVLRLSRPLEVFRAIRKNDFIKPWPPSEGDTGYCPAYWADIKIGRGSCGFRCRACFLIGTHRNFCDPSRHILYENVEDFEAVVRNWLLNPDRSTLGLGIDCSDGLLYEGVTGHARRLIPLFANEKTNPHNCKLLILTKSTNIHYLKNIPNRNIIISFSLNPEPIADLWEGKWPDGLRITPYIEERLNASLTVARWGFEVRWRIDPIIDSPGWEKHYEMFFRKVAKEGHQPTRLTLGTYREMKRSLLTVSERWGLPPMEWQPSGLVKDGQHWHLPDSLRIHLYRTIITQIKSAWNNTIPIIALCKETTSVRKALGIDHSHCNCE